MSHSIRHPLRPSPGRRGARRGVALVIVLAFVVLLTGLVIAFFSRSLLDRQISNSSVGRAKVSDFADGASNSIIGNLKQEIVLSSTAYPLSSGTLYVPQQTGSTAYDYMLPQMTSGTYPLNLLKISGTGAFFTGSNGTVPTNAIAVSSTTPSLNERFISPVRWNEHYLLPFTSSTDSFPTMTGATPFVPPSWVLVTKSGSNPVIPVIGSFNGSNSQYLSGGSNAVIGRYAYAIYHEGGLLDVNAAGYPSTTGTMNVYKDSLGYADLTQVFAAAGVTGTTGTNCVDQLVAWRNYASTQSPGPFISPGFTVISASNYGNFILSNTTGFLTASSTNLYNNQSDRVFESRQDLVAFAKQVWGFGPYNAAPFSNAGLNVLNYLTTFTRDLNQPSYVPVQSVDPVSPGYNSMAPHVLAPSAGGNNAGGFSPAIDNQINCAFPTVLVTSSNSGWQRNDGSLAVAGEPLVKKRFALNRLAWLTYGGPSSQRNLSSPTASGTDADIWSLENNYGISASFLQQGTPTNIKNYFGLVWTGSNSSWTYVHAGGESGSGPIMRVGRPLSVTAPISGVYVQDAGREPDFFELLKAAINIGSLGKASTIPPASGQAGTYTFANFYNQYYTDSSIDCQIIQIGANIIDQFKTDNFPVHIVYDNGDGPSGAPDPRDFYGIENLPYLYRLHPAVVKAVAPAATTGTGQPMNFGAPPNSYLNSDAVGANDYLATSGTITNTGLGVVMLIPELWNPHDWNSLNLFQTLGAPVMVSGSLPIRIYAQVSGTTPIVLMAANTNNGQALMAGDPTLFRAGGSTQSPGYTNYGFSWSGNQQILSLNSTQMTLGIPYSGVGAQLFREPTVLYEPGAPVGSGLSAPPLMSAAAATTAGLGPITTATSVFQGQGIRAVIGDLSTTMASGTAAAEILGQSYIGMYLGTLPLIWQESVATDTHIYYNRWVTLDKVTYPYGIDVTVYLQYQDGGGNWHTYDQKEFTLGHEGIGFGKIAAPMHHYWAGFLDPYTEGDREYLVLDPRTSRFGVQTSSLPQAPTGSPTPWLLWNFPPFTSDPGIFSMPNGGAPGIGTAGYYSRWLSQTNGIMTSLRDGWGIGGTIQAVNSSPGNPYNLVPYNFATQMGFSPGNNGTATAPFWTWSNSTSAMRLGLLSENMPFELYSDRLNGDGQWIGAEGITPEPQATGQFYSDADGVVRRAMGGWSDLPSNWRGQMDSFWSSNYAELMGLPMRIANSFSTTDNALHKTDIFDQYPPALPSSAAPLLQSESRSMILHRPFRSVAELAYSFSGTPWKDLDLTSPESGNGALLDVFCINDTANPNALMAGRVNLNTRQQPVLQAIFAGEYKDEMMSGTSQISAPPTYASTVALSNTLALSLVARTSGTALTGPVTISGTGIRPLQNLADLVGRWVKPVAAGGADPQLVGIGPPPYDPTSYDGFTADLFNPQWFLTQSGATDTPDNSPNDVDQTMPTDAVVYDKTIMRRRGAPIRALSNAGQTRVWNLLIDIVAQTGRYPQAAASAGNPAAAFLVEGERHYWVHVAIDRLTGQVIDKQVETVKE